MSKTTKTKKDIKIVDVKIKAVRKYNDLKLGKTIEVGEEYYVTKERAEEILKVGYAELAEETKEIVDDEAGTEEAADE